MRSKWRPMRIHHEKDLEKSIHQAHLCSMYAAYVRGSRHALGINQTTLAELLGVNRSTLVRLEKGDPPLKQTLVMAAIDVLEQLGARMDDVLAPEQAVELKFSVSLEKVRQIGAVGSDKEGPQDLLHALLPADFKPPLKESPLRKDKPKPADRD